MSAPLVLLHVSMIIINLISYNGSPDQTLLKLFLEDMLRKLSTAFNHPLPEELEVKNSHSRERMNVSFNDAVSCQDYIASVVDE